MKILKNNNGYLMLAIALFSVFFFGCGTSKPKQFPEIVPVTLTVLRDGKPLANARVKLYYDVSINSAVVSGTTNNDGVCKFRTALAEYIADGAPIGHATVTMMIGTSQDSGAKQPKSQEEAFAMQEELRKLHEEAQKVIPPCLLTQRDSTLTYDIPAQGGEFVVNLEEYDDVELLIDADPNQSIKDQTRP